MPPAPLRFLRRLIAPALRRRRDRDMDAEIAFHVESAAREYVHAGMNEADALREARRRLGRTLQIKEDGHEVRGIRWVENLIRDFRLTGRSLRRTPGFAAAVVLTLGLGIGINTAIFSVVDQVLLRPLPYPDGGRLVMVYETFNNPGKYESDHNVVSPANWLDWQQQSHTLQSIAAWQQVSRILTGAGDPARIVLQPVSAEFFPLLGVRPLLGRTVSQDDDRPGAPPVVVLSHHLWIDRFGGDPSAMGRTVQLDDRPARVVGVMPDGFQFAGPEVDLWNAYQMDRHRDFRHVEGRYINVVARLAPGVSVSDAQAEMNTIASHLAQTHVFNQHTGVRLVPLREELSGDVRSSLLALYAAVGVLLTIACFNVANLLLARAGARRHEIAVRVSLGAGRAAIVQQVLVESVVLAAAGGLLGFLLARWSVPALVAVAPPNLLRVPALAVDAPVLLYALGLSLATGVIVGIVPGVLVVRRSTATSIRTGRTTIRSAARVRRVMLVIQVALTVVLLCGAGLLARTVLALDDAKTGVVKRDVLTMEVALPGGRYTDDRSVAFFRDALAALRALPGVESAAAANSLAVIGSPRGGSWFHRLGTPEPPPAERPVTLIRIVTPGFFRTVGVPVLRGREFTDADEASRQSAFLVNEAFVRQYLRDADPLTVSLTVWMQADNPYLPVIGVVGDVNEGSVRSEAKPTVYYDHGRMPATRMTLFLRAQQPLSLARAAVAEIHRIDPNLPVTKVRTYEDAFAESVARDRLSAMVAVAFAVCGLTLAALGLYALLAFLVTERTREIGLRLALGAQAGRLRWSIVWGGLWLVGLGAAIGTAGSLVLMRALGTLLFGVTPFDTATYAGVLVLLLLVAVASAYLPARRASRIEPLIALRQE